VVIFGWRRFRKEESIPYEWRGDLLDYSSSRGSMSGAQLRRGLRNRLAHAEGAAFLVNPAAKIQTPTTTSTLSPLKA